MFLIKALCFYAVVHSYVYWKMAAAAPKSRRLRIVLAVALSGMAVAPVVGRVLESWGLLGGLAGPLQLLGFSWLAVVFWFCSSALVLDTWNLGVRLLSLGVPSAKTVRLSPRVKLAMISDSGLTLGADMYAIMEADGIVGLFDHFTFSDQTGTTKPMLRQFNHTLHRLGVSAEQAVHVGDLERTDVGGAHSAGMRAIRILHSWEDAQTAADASVNRLGEVLDVLRQWGVEL